MVSYSAAALCLAVAAASSSSSGAFGFVPASSPRRAARHGVLAPLRSTAEDAPPATVTSSDDDDQDRAERIAQWRRPDLESTTLVESTLEEMETDSDFLEATTRLSKLGRDGMTKEERARRRRALDDLGVPQFGAFLEKGTEGKAGPVVRRREPKVLQLNVGLYCNQACGHCHVESSPLRKETMSAETAARCVELLGKTPSIDTLDLTGGAPELNESFRYLVTAARDARGGSPDELDIIDRCNLTVLKEPGQEDLVEFLVRNKVHVVASLPCYSAENVDKQRGNGVFERSISGLLALNEAGYGVPGSGLILDLVYNPLGAFLPPEQSALEQAYKKELDDNFGIRFNSLFTMTNMPVKRFADYLHREGKTKEYMELLVNNFNPSTADGLMCLDTVSVGWDGGMYDCDFNQQLGYNMQDEGKRTVFDVESLTELMDVPVRTDNHCFGCTAGMGSS